MTDTAVIAIAASVAPTIAALGAVYLGYLANQKADRADARATQIAIQSKATSEKADVIIEKATEIHTLTNSNLSKVSASLEVALERIVGLEKLIAQMVHTAEARDAEPSPPPSR